MRGPVTPDSIAELFSYHAPHGDQVSRYERIRAAGKTLALEIMECTPASPEQTLAIRSVHLATMHANSAIACNELAGAGEGIDS